MGQNVVQLGGVSRAKLIKRGQLLEYFTIGYNSLEDRAQQSELPNASEEAAEGDDLLLEGG